jgi:putative endonuclease
MLEFFYLWQMEFKVYILFSKTKNKYYIGFTSNIEERIIRHNQKSKGFTGNVNDWKLVYFENYQTKEEAHKRELQIKSWKSRIKIQELISKKD